ncbi:MAG: hypothetical protein QW478_14740, partial [Candidatus Micrarchaeaceae archaeon]
PNLQVRLNINFASLVSNINADLGNIRFSSDQAGNNLLYAWLESAPQGTFTQSSSISSYTSSNVWVNLGNNIIPANGLLTIYMQILATGTEFDGVYWGANPQWTSTYGQYDNGANVFNFYDNFAGITLSSKWVANGANYSVSNGLTYKTNSNYPVLLSAVSFTEPYVIDWYGYATATTGDAGIYFDSQSDTANSNANLWAQRSSTIFGGIDQFYVYTSGGYTAYGSWPYSINGNYNVYTLLADGSTLSVQTNYLTQETYTAFPTTYTSGYFGPRQIISGDVEFWQWVRVRIYPPNGTDPVLTSITLLLVGNYTSTSTLVLDWSVLKGKPYVTVSAKGISNGLSNIPNDGADFGPDTLLGATSLNQYGPPYTQTVGIQEAINYIASIGGGTIKLNDGTYDVTNAPLQYAGETGGNTYYTQILIPIEGFGSNMIEIAIIGNPASRGGLESSWITYYTGGVTIKSLYQTSDINTFLIAAPFVSGNLTNINLFIDGIHIQTSPTSSMGGISLEFITGVVIGKLYIDTYSVTLSPSGTLVTTLNSGIGMIWGAPGNSAALYADEIVVIGYNIGMYLITSHQQINKLMANSCVTGLYIIGAPFGAHIGQYDAQLCRNQIEFGNSSTNAWCVIDLISLGDQFSSGSGYAYDYEYVVKDDGGGGVHYLKANLVNEGDVPAVYSLTTNSVVKINHANSPPTATIPANPPASATVYQNTNPFDIRIYLPAYATTSGTAGSVAIALGSSSTPSTIGTKFINGSTSSSATEIIELVVPAGWYYEFTATGVTFGTATVLPA